MSDLDFPAAFQALTGQTPFAWQRRLFERFATGELPDAVDVPTGLGKTKVMALWLIARALGAKLPRRLVYVVDRRAVVDQATDEATGLAEHLPSWLASLAPEDASRVRQRLGLISPAGDLPVSTLRGQFLDNRKWLESPAATAIVVGTVDMIGSRLLFEGYGVSRGMRPAHAGLIGADSLVVLDEAHLVPPFEALMRQAAAMGRLAPVPAMHVMSLSATGREQGGAVFRLKLGDEGEDHADERAMARLSATKRLWLMADAGPKNIAQRLADQAWSFGEGGRRVIIFCNSRTTAQAVEIALTKRQRETKTLKGAGLTALLVGERRYRERERLRGDGTDENPGDPIFRSFFPGTELAEAAAVGRPAFLIATSAGEVGVDVDADDLVCDLVTWERMVQRFGRVNRRAEPGEARIAVIPVADETEAEDEIKADRLTVLKAPFLSGEWPAAPAMGPQNAASPEAILISKDASPGTLAALKNSALKDALEAATTPEPLRPPLTRATLDAWSLTSLKNHSGRPKVEPWLRGWIDKEPQTTVLWRRIFPLRKGEEHVTDDLRAFFEAAPPHMSETLEAPSWRVADLLRERAKRMSKGVAAFEDVAEEATSDDEEEAADADAGDPDVTTTAAAAAERETTHRPVVVVLGRDGAIERVQTIDTFRDQDAKRLAARLAGRTIVLDARIGGLDALGLLSNAWPTKIGDPLPDSSDMQDQTRWGDRLLEASGKRVRWDTPDGEGDGEELSSGWFPFPFSWRLNPDRSDSPVIRIDAWKPDGVDPIEPALGREQLLRDHHKRARAAAGRIATALSLPDDLRQVLETVAAFHDAGKARSIWQIYARNADWTRDANEHPPLAKFSKRSHWRRLLIGNVVYRHEFGSLCDALADIAPPGLEVEHAAVRALPLHFLDLALHLLTAHHGDARPAIAAAEQRADGCDTDALAREAALRFARLQRQWGPWGLAWWEVLLRAADWAASRENDARDIGDEARDG